MKYFERCSFGTNITIIINNEEYDIEVNAFIEPGDNGTYWEPPTEDEIEYLELEDIDYPSDEITYNEMEQILEDYLNENYDNLLKSYYNYLEGLRNDEADYRYHNQKDFY